MDVTEYPTREGTVYLAAVLDAYSRRVVGWSIADHIRSELVVDALQMAICDDNHPTVRRSHTATTEPRHIVGVRSASPQSGLARFHGLDR